jgi:hypothetical protein
MSRGDITRWGVFARPCCFIGSRTDGGQARAEASASDDSIRTISYTALPGMSVRWRFAFVPAGVWTSQRALGG